MARANALPLKDPLALLRDRLFWNPNLPGSVWPDPEQSASVVPGPLRLLNLSSLVGLLSAYEQIAILYDRVVDAHFASHD